MLGSVATVSLLALTQCKPMDHSPRHGMMMGGLPQEYQGLVNPLAESQANIKAGEGIYLQQCSSCHGVTGQGDGPAAAALNPKPANLDWVVDMPMMRDAMLYWSISEGGKEIGSAMPAFKEILTEQERWLVITYMQDAF